MNLELFIARKIHFQTPAKKSKSNITKPAVRIAIAGIALGIAVMIISVGVITGFKHEIREKLIGFSSHIQITSLTNNNTFEMAPISFSATLVDSIKQIPEVRNTCFYCTKPAIIKTSNDFQGLAFNGVDNNYDWTFFKNNLKEGRLPDFSDTLPSKEILISRKIASMLNISVGDGILTYFIQSNVRVRKFTVSGIYETGLQDFDKMFMIGDLRQVQSLNGWNSDEVGGMNIWVKNFNKSEETAYEIFETTANKFEQHGSTYYTRTIRELQPQIFGWLALLDTNVIVILILMMLVAGFNMISGLLILILDKTNMIGVLKSMGLRDWSIRKIFLYQSCFLIGKGLLLGNIFGICICLIQEYFKIIPLDPSVYYVDTVPIILQPTAIIGLNIMAAIVSLLMLLIPSHVIAKISPAKSIRFE